MLTREDVAEPAVPVNVEAVATKVLHCADVGRVQHETVEELVQTRGGGVLVASAEQSRDGGIDAAVVRGACRGGGQRVRARSIDGVGHEKHRRAVQVRVREVITLTEITTYEMSCRVDASLLSSTPVYFCENPDIHVRLGRRHTIV